MPDLNFNESPEQIVGSLLREEEQQTNTSALSDFAALIEHQMGSDWKIEKQEWSMGSRVKLILTSRARPGESFDMIIGYGTPEDDH